MHAAISSLPAPVLLSSRSLCFRSWYWRCRFFRFAAKARDYHQLLNRPAGTHAPPAEKGADYCFIKCKYEKIHFEDILYVEGMQNYIDIYSIKGKYVTLLYLKNPGQNLEGHSFIRVHKSYIVSIYKIDRTNPATVVFAANLD